MMTFKKTQYNDSLTFFLLVVSFAITSLFICSIVYAESQDKPKILIFEFSLKSSKEDDKELKKLLYSTITDSLIKSRKLDVSKVYEHEFLSMHKKKIDYAKEKKARYIIDGEIERLSDKSIKVQIRLIDVEKDGDVPLLNEEGKTEDDLEKIKPLLNIVSDKISSLIEGAPLKEAVYTVCFEGYSNEEDVVKNLRTILPLYLKNELKEKKVLKVRYKFESLTSEEAESICIAKTSRVDLEIYDVVIKGTILPLKGTTERLTVTVEVIKIKEDSHALLEGFIGEIGHDKKSQFIKELSNFIEKKWPFKDKK